MARRKTILRRVRTRIPNLIPTEQGPADEELRRREERFRALINLVPEMVWEAAPDGTMITVGDRWQRYTGMSAEQLARDWPQLVLHPDDYERCVTEWARARQQGTPYEIEVRNRRYDGQYRWFLTRAMPLTDATGQVSAWYGTTVDIHDRKLLEARLQENEARFLLALDTAHAGSFEWDVATDAVLWSPQHFVILGLEPDSLTPDYHAWHSRIHPDDVAMVEAHMAAAIAAHRDVTLEYRIVRPDGTARWVRASGHVLYSDADQPLRMVGMMIDITERKEVEAERERLLTELQRINAELQQFSYIVSHDLNEPLRTMNNFVQLLARHMQDKLDDTAHEYMRFITDAAHRMQQMLADLLAYTRAGQMPEFRAVDCEAVLGQVLAALQTRIAECNAVVTHDPLPTVQGDATRLGQVWQNLLSNALKFCDQKPPRVHISAVAEERHWRFTVRDNGIGIEAQHVGRLFQVFQRLHTRSEYAGSGIGLAICKRIVEQHGGRIWVDSCPHHGSTFSFTISRAL